MSTDAKAIIKDGKIEISINIADLPLIVNVSCALNAVSGFWKVTEPYVFAKEVCSALNSESETGTTDIHRMFDKAFNDAIEQGGLGIEPIPEDEFEQECARFQSQPRSR